MEHLWAVFEIPNGLDGTHLGSKPNKLYVTRLAFILKLTNDFFCSVLKHSCSGRYSEKSYRCVFFMSAYTSSVSISTSTLSVSVKELCLHTMLLDHTVPEITHEVFSQVEDGLSNIDWWIQL